MSKFSTLAEVLAPHADFVSNLARHCSCGTWHDHSLSAPHSRLAFSQHQAEVWRDACTSTPAEDLDRVPARSIVRSDAGTIACRFDGRNGVVFGDDRPFPWHNLALPAVVLWHPDWSES